jgi:hypothetical protein
MLCFLCGTAYRYSISADPDHFDTDPGPTFHFDTSLDPVTAVDEVQKLSDMSY